MPTNFLPDLPTLSRRREFLKALGALGLLSVPRLARPDAPVAELPPSAFCGAGERGSPLFIPATRGMLGRLTPDGAPFTLRAGTRDSGNLWPLGYSVALGERQFVNPTLVLHPGSGLLLPAPE